MPRFIGHEFSDCKAEDGGDTPASLGQAERTADFKLKSDDIYKYNALHRSYLFNIVDCYIAFDMGVIKLFILDFHKSAIKERELFAPYHDKSLIMAAMPLIDFLVFLLL